MSKEIYGFKPYSRTHVCGIESISHGVETSFLDCSLGAKDGLGVQGTCDSIISLSEMQQNTTLTKWTLRSPAARERATTSRLWRRQMWIAQELQASTHNFPSTSHSGHQLKTFSSQATKIGLRIAGAKLHRQIKRNRGRICNQIPP